MFKHIARYRERMDKSFSKPRLWWSLWILGAVYFLYMLIFNAIFLLRNNYGLPGDIAVNDISMGRLLFFAINIPLTFFTCLLTGHVVLGLHKLRKLR